MRVDGFYVIGCEVSGGAVVFMQTYMAGGLPMKNWDGLEFADRYLMFGDAKKAAESAPCGASVWKVEVNATKMGGEG